MPKYTEGICGDGVAILRDGVPVPISEILRQLNYEGECSRMTITGSQVSATCCISTLHAAAAGARRDLENGMRRLTGSTCKPTRLPEQT